jgi:hypothetical protein
MRADHRRTKIITIRWSEYEYELLKKLATRSGAKTPSAYLRARALSTEQTFRMPAFETLRDMRNELIKLRVEIGKVGGLTRRLETSCIDAMDAISRF